MEAWNVVLPILVAMLMGAGIPLLFQVWMTIKSARRVAERVDRVTARLEEGQRVDELMAAIDSVSKAARQVGEGVKVASTIGAAIGPAAAAAVHAWRATAQQPVAERVREPARPREGTRGGQARVADEVLPVQGRESATAEKERHRAPERGSVAQESPVARESALPRNGGNAVRQEERAARQEPRPAREEREERS